MAETVREVIGKKVSLILVPIILMIYVGWLLLEFVAAAQLMTALSDWSYELCVLLVAGVIATYLWAGGFQALMRTDLLQAFFIGVLLLTFFVLPENLKTPDFTQLGTGHVFNLSAVIGLAAGSIISVFCGAEAWQRAIAGRSASVTRNAFFWAVPILSIMTAFFCYIGFSLYLAYPEASPETYISLLMENIPGWFAPILFVCLMALVMSTLDTLGFIVAQTLMNDGLSKIIGKDTQHPRKILKIGILITFFGTAGLAMIFQDVIEILYFLFAYWAVLAPALFVFLKTPPSESAIIASVLLAFVSITGLQVTGLYQDWMNVITFIGLLSLPLFLDKMLPQFCKN